MLRHLFLRTALLVVTVLGACVCTAADTAPLPESLPPYLQNPAADGMTVCFAAQKEIRGATVRWQLADGTGKPVETAAAGTVVPGTSWTVWKARLAPLKPGTAYEYQVRFTRGTDAGTAPACRFHTPDPRAESFRAVFVNDIHNRSTVLEALMKHVQPDDYEMSFLLGDMWTDPSPAKGADQVFRSLDAYIRLLHASEKPMLLIRGNHETRGGFAKTMACLFDIPGLDAAAGEFDQQWQFTLRAGPAWFLALDGGDDFTKRFDKFQPLRRRQADWLKKALARKDDDGCWRILLTHMPLYNNNIWNSEPCRQMWEPVLSGAGIDLELGGHDHGGKLLPKGKTYDIVFDGHYPDQQDTQKRKGWSCTTPWPVMIGGGPDLTGRTAATVMLLRADGKTLAVRMLGLQPGKPLAELTLDAKAGQKTPAP